MTYTPQRPSAEVMADLRPAIVEAAKADAKEDRVVAELDRVQEEKAQADSRVRKLKSELHAAIRQEEGVDG